MGQALGVSAGEKVQHGGIPGNHHGVDLLHGDTCLFRQAANQLADPLAHRFLKGLSLPCQGLLDAGDYISAIGFLRIAAARLGQQALSPIELGRQGGGAQVQGHTQLGKQRHLSQGRFAAQLDRHPSGLLPLHLTGAQNDSLAGQAQVLLQLLGGELFPLRGGGLS